VSHLAQRAIREYDAKQLLARHWSRCFAGLPPYSLQAAQIRAGDDLESLPASHPWLLTTPLVLKPDVLAGRRGKHGLVALDVRWPEARAWLRDRLGQSTTIGGVTGRLTHFLVQPFVPIEAEHYLSIRTGRDSDEILYAPEGGVDIESHWSLASTLHVPVWPRHDSGLPPLAEQPWPRELSPFVSGLYRFFVELGFTYLEINPLALSALPGRAGGAYVPLDLKCRLDDAARHDCGALWGEIEFPVEFGRAESLAERYVAQLDARSGASLKLTVLNPEGTVWTMVAGGGASVIYTDTIADLGYAGELANYGEYSGNPPADLTYEYARTIIGLMTQSPAPPGRSKSLLIGGGIANFTDVAETFGGIIRALRERAAELRATPVRIFVRRGGPNYAEGLRQMEALGREIGVPVVTFGPEAHMTRIVSLALAGASGGGW
jgi:ATP-citrate lyase beta-subunit